MVTNLQVAHLMNCTDPLYNKNIVGDKRPIGDMC